MPNWCQNELVIEGSKEEIKAFKEMAIEKVSTEGNPEQLFFYNFLDKELLNEVKNDRNKQIEIFSVKWGACQSELMYESDNELTYGFETPWGPPKKFLLLVSEMFPSLTFRLKYIEASMLLRGVIVTHNGAILDNTYCEGEEFEDWLKENDPDVYDEWLCFDDEE